MPEDKAVHFSMSSGAAWLLGLTCVLATCVYCNAHTHSHFGLDTRLSYMHVL